MKGLLWLLVLAAFAWVAWALWRAQRRLRERREAEQARAASLLAQALHRPKEAAGAAPEEKLLLDAADKAGAAGEAALAIQLYARLMARFPQSDLLAQARAGVEAQKKRLAMPRAPGTSVPG